MQNRSPAKADARDETVGNAIYPGKEEWKNEPGNRYTPEELQAMDKNWRIQIINPYQPRVCKAD